MNTRGLGRDVLSDEALLARLIDQLGRSRRVEAELVALIAEVDARHLYLREACASMHAYATERLRLSDAEAYLRITVARLSRRFPVVLVMLSDGRLHLSGIAKLAPHLHDGNVDAVLARAANRSTRDIEKLVAELSPRPDAPSLIRRLPRPQSSSALSAAGELRADGVLSDAAAGGSSSGARDKVASGGSGSAGASIGAESSGAESSVVAGQDSSRGSSGPARPASVIAPTAPGRYKVQFTAGDELRDKITRAQGLLRHQVPDGDLAAIVDRAMTLLLRELERARFAATSSPRKSVDDVDPTPSSRAIPAPIRRAVWVRDGGRCTFRSPRGERCSATERLEFHHVIPFAHGGDHSEGNVAILCKFHNAYQAEIDFGAECIAAHRRKAPPSRPAVPGTPGSRAREAQGTTAATPPS